MNMYEHSDKYIDIKIFTDLDVYKILFQLPFIWQKKQQLMMLQISYKYHYVLFLHSIGESNCVENVRCLERSQEFPSVWVLQFWFIIFGFDKVMKQIFFEI